MSVRIVSFLGLGKKDRVHPDHPDRAIYYERGRYELDGVVLARTTHLREVALAEQAVERVGRERVSVVVLGTEQVEQMWFGDDAAYRWGFEEAGLSDLPIGLLHLPSGNDAQERWAIFNAVCRALRPEPLELEAPGIRPMLESEPPQEILIDITHGFRSLPFFAASAIAFTQSQRRREGGGGYRLRILYAAHDYAKPPNVEAITPIWDLSQFLDVLRWDAGIDALMRHGRADELAALLADVEATLRSDARDAEAHRALQPLRRFHQAAQTFADGLVTLRVPDVLAEYAAALHEAAPATRHFLEEHAPPVAGQLDRIESMTAPLRAARVVSEEGIDAAIALGELYLRFERYAELAALIRETLVTGWTVATHSGGELQQPTKDHRLFDEQRHLAEREAMRPSGDPPAVSRLLRRDGALRNDVLHGGYRSNRQTPAKVRKELADALDRMRTHRQELTKPITSRPTTHFVNCSNHPSDGWSEEQRTAATSLVPGHIVDLEGGFPLVPPSASSEDVERIAEDVARHVLALDPAIVHVAGEMSATFAIVRRLGRAGVGCVCATTERVASEIVTPDGTQRHHVFRFVAWRRYGS